MTEHNPVLVALDFASAEEATRMAKLVGPSVGGFKVGLELLMGPGPATVAAIVRLGKPVFVDAKLHDIPNTVLAASRQLGRMGARWLTVHAAGGREQMEAAVEGLDAGSGGRESGVLAVTVLTSLSDADLAQVGVTGSTGRQTSRLAKLAEASGVEGVICAVKELGVVGEVAPASPRITPGIRPEGVTADDQKRVATPAEAIRRGAEWLVIGRAITRAPDPREAADAIVASLIERGEAIIEAASIEEL